MTGRAVRQVLRPVRGAMAVGIALASVGAAASIPAYVGLLRLTEALRSGTEIRDPMVLLVSGLGAQALLAALALLVTHVADVRLQAQLRRRLADKLARLPLGWFDERSTGRVRHLLQNDVDALHQLVAHAVVEFVTGTLTPLAGIGFCFWLDWRLGLMTLLPLLTYPALFMLVAPRGNRDTMEQINASSTRISSAIVEYVNGIAVLKIFGRAQEGSRTFAEASRDYRSTFVRLVRPQMRAHAIASATLTAPVVAAAMLAVGLFGVQRSWFGPDSVLVAMVVAILVPASFVTFMAGTQLREQATAAADRIVEVLQTEELAEPAEPRSPNGHDLRVDGVTFRYQQAGPPAVDDVSFTVAQGSVTALVGASGSGKSTLAALVCRFRDVDSGRIRIGGVDVREMGEDTLRQTVSTVLQDVQLLGVSIRDNIRLARPEVSDDVVIGAARAVGIHDEIVALPRGYDSVVGRDARLSGGQAQRVCIARTLVADAPILVLDEATSATDPESESLIQQALERVSRGRTVLVVAHRLHTVRGADQIVVLDGGRVIEQGRHDELLELGGRYAELWDAAESLAPTGSMS